MIPLFEDQRVQDVDILAIQEPWRNPVQATTYHPLKRFFGLVFEDRSNNTRVCFFVNKRLALSEWSFTHHTPDLCTLHLKIAELRKIHIHNVYNPCSSGGDDLSNGSIPNLMKAIQYFPDDELLAMGDFNLHHSAWGESDIGQNDKGASFLLEWMLEKGLEQILPLGTVTYSERGAKNTIDLVFGSE